MHRTPALFLRGLQVPQHLLYAIVIQEFPLIWLKQIIRGVFIIFLLILMLTHGFLKLSQKDQLQFLPWIERVLGRQLVILLEGERNAGVFSGRCEETLVDVLAHLLQMVHWLFQRTRPVIEERRCCIHVDLILAPSCCLHLINTACRFIICEILRGQNIPNRLLSPSARHKCGDVIQVWVLCHTLLRVESRRQMSIDTSGSLIEIRHSI